MQMAGKTETHEELASQDYGYGSFCVANTSVNKSAAANIGLFSSRYSRFDTGTCTGCCST